jgi:serine/threonine protein kinase
MMVKMVREDKADRVRPLAALSLRHFLEFSIDDPVEPDPTDTPLSISSAKRATEFRYSMAMKRYKYSLDNLTPRMEKLALSMVEDVWTCMEKALNALHGHGYVHMDVKPANICVHSETRGSYVLIDVGSVAAVDPGGEARSHSTLSYVPKELHPSAGRTTIKVDKKVDWWMLAVTLLEITLLFLITSESLDIPLLRRPPQFVHHDIKAKAPNRISSTCLAISCGLGIS